MLELMSEPLSEPMLNPQLKRLRKDIVQKLWKSYYLSSPDMQRIATSLKEKGIIIPALDHFAVIDLPGPHSGIPHMSQIFSTVGYVAQGHDYLAEKQNDFMWMTESGSANQPARDVLPQIVTADFRLDEMPVEIKNIIYKYSSQTQPSPITSVQTLSKLAANSDMQALEQCSDMIIRYFAGRDWELPSTKEFHLVSEFNELLAWVLVFGRRPNHFTLSIHLLDPFENLNDFHCFIENEANLSLNHEGGVVKGGQEVGVAQSSTSGIVQTIPLSDGKISIPTGFVEFVWRYPRYASQPHPVLWDDYFTGFIANHADKVIESLYIPEAFRG
jgi:hypothetical protein